MTDLSEQHYQYPLQFCVKWMYREIKFGLSLPATSWPRAIALASNPFLQLDASADSLAWEL